MVVKSRERKYEHEGGGRGVGKREGAGGVGGGPLQQKTGIHV